MKVSKAIERIEGYVEVWDLEQADEEIKMIIFKDDIKAFKIAIEALEKQIPKKLKHKDFYQGYKCECGSNIPFQKQNYCCDCGQKLDWGDIVW